jgi:uncharacterized protein (TIGR03437 family)
MIPAALRLAVLAAALAGVVAPHSWGQNIRILAITSAADFSSSWILPGGLGAIFCSGLAGISGTVAAPGFPLPTTLSGVTVTIGPTLHAPLLAVADLGGYQQINFQLPWETPAGSPIAISQGSASSPPAALPANPVWSVFFKDSAGAVIAQHASDFSLVTPGNPARPGEWIIAYASNLGSVAAPPPSGTPAPLDRLSPIAGSGVTGVVLVSDNGPRAVESNFIGLTPGAAGLYQVNLRIPDGYRDAGVRLAFSRLRFCGFFFVPGCGRGFVTEFSSAATLPFMP